MRIRHKLRDGEDPAAPNITCPACEGKVCCIPGVAGDWVWKRIEEGVELPGEAIVNAADLSDQVLNHTRPCQRLSCKHSLICEIQDINATHECRPIKIAYPDVSPGGEGWMPSWDKQSESCVLDMIRSNDNGVGEPVDLERIGAAQNRSIERVRQLLHAGLFSLKIRLRWLEQHPSGLPKPRATDRKETK